MALALMCHGTDLLAALQVSDEPVITNNGYQQTGTMSFRVEAAPEDIAVANENEVAFYDDVSGVVYYAGRVKTVTPVAATPGWRILDVECQDATTLADMDVIDAAVDPTGLTDKQFITAVFAAHGTKGITVGTECQELATTVTSETPFLGLTLAEFMDAICGVTGGSWYVDYYMALHYFAAESEAAPFAISDTPDGVTSFMCDGLSLPEDSLDLKNAVYYVPGTGGDAVPTWYEDAASIAATAAAGPSGDDGRREAFQQDDRITLQSTLDRYGAAFLASHGVRRAGNFTCIQPGLRAGMSLHITDANSGLSDVAFAVVSVTTRLVQVSADPADVHHVTTLADSAVVFEVSFGDRPVTLGSMSKRTSAAIASLATQVVNKVDRDSTPPAVPTGLTLTASVVQGATGPISVVVASLTQPTDADTLGCWVELTDVAGPDFTNPVAVFIGMPGTTGIFSATLPLTAYWARTRSVDTAGNFSAYSSAATVTTPADTVAPDVPTFLVVLPGFRGLGCAWNPVTAPDLDHYELQFAPEDPSNLGNPNTGLWSNLPVGTTTTHFLSGLDPALLWFVQAQAVDSSGNASGWTTSASATPLLVGSTDIAAATAVIDFVRTGLLTADAIASGKVTIKTSGGATAIEIRDGSGNLLGSWDPTNGIILRDPASPTTRWLQLASGLLRLTVDGGATYSSAITPDGINAAAINFGTAQGGQNVVLNPSFERAPFLQLQTALITTTADWTADETANDNRTIGSNSISVAAW
jgi:hypothetical protein